MVRAATPYVAAVLFSAGCGQILDIEDAHLISTAGAGAGDGGDIPSAGAGNPPSPCDEYCSVITSDCIGKDAQYIDADACLQACRYFPVGTPGETQGNTLACRLTYAKKARSEPYTYCTWAGPGGDGECGTNCEGFCTLMMAACTAASTGPGHEYFDSLSDCHASCNELDDVGSYNTSDRSLQSGADTVQCRLYHVGAALAADDSFTHCSHAIGDRSCVNPASGVETSGP